SGVTLGLLAGFDGDDLGDPAAFAPGSVGLWDGFDLELDDDVDVFGDDVQGVLAGDVGAGLGGAGDELADGALGGAGVGGRHRSATRLHALEHGHDLIAADFTDDGVGEVRPQGVLECVTDRVFPCPASGGADLPRSRFGLPFVHHLMVTGV